MRRTFKRNGATPGGTTKSFIAAHLHAKLGMRVLTATMGGKRSLWF